MWFIECSAGSKNRKVIGIQKGLSVLVVYPLDPMVALALWLKAPAQNQETV